MNKAIAYLCKIEPNFKTIIDLYGQPKIPTRPQGFATLVLLILEQQVSINSAKAHFVKLSSIAKNIMPKQLLALSDIDYRAAGVSRQKTVYIKALATAVINKTLVIENLANMPTDEVRQTLIQIKGIGNWTIDVYLMFSLQAPNILPLGDIAVVNTITALWQITNKTDMEILGNNWHPYKTTATFLLWHYYLCKRGRIVEY